MEHYPVEGQEKSERFSPPKNDISLRVATLVEAKMGSAPEEEKREVAAQALELYEKAQDVVAPVIVGFADHLLKQAIPSGEKARIVFVARDGIGPYKAARALAEKFPDRYSGVTPEQLSYVYLTRKVVQNASPETLRKYFAELGIREGDVITLADIGMYGTILSELREKLGELAPANAEYLISRTNQARGFIDNGKDKRVPALAKITGNPAVHFLEDTFSGNIKSPSFLEMTEDGLQPDTRDTEYESEVAIKREVALLAIEDYVAGLPQEEVGRDLAEDVRRLNNFLLDPKNFKKIMVPHER